jgi:hypothetical protein
LGVVFHARKLKNQTICRGYCALSVFIVMDQSRHRSLETLRGYVRDAEIFKEHAGAGLL